MNHPITKNICGNGFHNIQICGDLDWFFFCFFLKRRESFYSLQGITYPRDIFYSLRDFLRVSWFFQKKTQLLLSFTLCTSLTLDGNCLCPILSYYTLLFSLIKPQLLLTWSYLVHSGDCKLPDKELAVP